jgi:hypothetical protein
MDCPECDRLRRERHDRERALATARALLSRASAGDDSAEYMRLRATAHEARLDLEIVEIQLRQHEDRHAIPN